ncbi:MAG: tRNA 2-thiouridine(34) synthase MnmA, partial [Gammaproteobacteria bacterium]
NHAKKDSTGICFIGERRFDDFLAGYLPSREGDMRDPNGSLIGRHRGLAYYTIGQRQGLGIGGLKGHSEAPWFVADKVLASNTLIVTQEQEDLLGTWLSVGEMNWLVPVPNLPLEAAAKIRYRQADQACRIVPRADGRLGVHFYEPQRAITPGQYACFYQDDICLGGGVIEARDPGGLGRCEPDILPATNAA